MQIFVLSRWWLLAAALFLALGHSPRAAAESPVILVLGDSLSAAYGLDPSEGWVALLQRRLDEEGYPHRVVNASVSGDTTAGGVSRLPAALDRHAPDMVLIELGGNDGLRGQPVAQMRDNLDTLIDLSRAAGAEPVLLEMMIPANYGPQYTRAFTHTYTELADAEDVALVPFFLGAFAMDPGAFQDDGIHPGAAAQPQMLDAVWAVIEPLLADD